MIKNRLNIYHEKLEKIFSNIDDIIIAYCIGSFARGEERRDSDLDIVLVLSSLSHFDYPTAYNDISNILSGYNLDLRVVIPKDTSPLFLFQLIKEGLCIFEKDSFTQTAFETYVMKIYYDSQHIRDIYNYYLQQRFTHNSYGK